MRDSIEADLKWVKETLRGHEEAIEQVAALPPELVNAMSAKLARRQLVLASPGFLDLVRLVAAHHADRFAFDDRFTGVRSPESEAFLDAMSQRAAVIAAKTQTFKRMLNKL